MPYLSYLFAANFALARTMGLRLQPVVGRAVLGSRTTNIVLDLIAERRLDAGDVAAADLDSGILITSVAARAGVECALDIFLADLDGLD
jgi:hypothetical protein